MIEEDKYFTRDISFKTLGSKELYSQLIEDIELLFDRAEEHKLVPRLMVVGPLFIEIASTQALIRELTINDWDDQVEQNLPIIKELVNKKIITVYKACEEQHGKFGDDSNKKIAIYFDPEEEYLNLHCVDPKSKSKNSDELKTKDGYHYVFIKFKLDEVLVEYGPLRRH